MSYILAYILYKYYPNILVSNSLMDIKGIKNALILVILVPSTIYMAIPTYIYCFYCFLVTYYNIQLFIITISWVLIKYVHNVKNYFFKIRDKL